MSAQVEDRRDLIRDRNIVIMTCSNYNQWLERLAVAEHMPVSVLVDRAINDYANRVRFEPAPRRRGDEEMTHAAQ